MGNTRNASGRSSSKVISGSLSRAATWIEVLVAGCTLGSLVLSSSMGKIQETCRLSKSIDILFGPDYVHHGSPKKTLKTHWTKWLSEWIEATKLMSRLAVAWWASFRRHRTMSWAFQAGWDLQPSRAYFGRWKSVFLKDNYIWTCHVAVVSSPKKWRCHEGLNARHDMLKTKSKEKSGDNLKKNWNVSAHRVSASLVKFTRFRYHRY